MLLISNDDGIDALGLLELEKFLSAHYAITVIAPAVEQSAASHALTLRDPVRATRRSESRVAVWGTPADCVYLGLHHFLKRDDVSLVVSGINKGTNLGTDIHYSGTVAAAKEGALAGVRSLAVSLDHAPLGAARRDAHWGTAAELACRVVERLLQLGDEDPLLWSLNIPDVPHSELKGLRVCRVGRRFYASDVQLSGEDSYRIGGPHQRFCDVSGTDGYWFSRGFATLSALSMDWSLEPRRALQSETVRALEGVL